MRASVSLLLFGISALIVAPPAAGQLIGISAQEDNGQLAEWLPHWRWADDEYTNGMSVTATWNGAVGWSGLVSHWTQGRTLTTDFTLGQKMYSPPSWDVSAAPVPGERPYVGWLYVGATAEVLSATRADALTIDLGMTGPPALAGQLQSAWHRWFGAQHPLGWSHQVPFAFAGVVSASETRDPARLAVSGVRVLSLEPTVQLNAGNWLAGATAKMEGRVGYNVAAPWVQRLAKQQPSFSLYLLSDVQSDYVWREFALDRPTFDPSLRVSKIPWVGQYAFGAGFRLQRFTLEYRGTTRAREYTTGPRVHAYGAISASLTL